MSCSDVDARRNTGPSCSGAFAADHRPAEGRFYVALYDRSDITMGFRDLPVVAAVKNASNTMYPRAAAGLKKIPSTRYSEFLVDL